MLSALLFLFILNIGIFVNYCTIIVYCILRLRKLYWLIGRRSQRTKNNKILIYNCILKPIWTYGIQLWGSAAKSNIAIIQGFQNKVIRAILDAHRSTSNSAIQKDTPIPTVAEEIRQYSHKYLNKLIDHSNDYAKQLMSTTIPKRFKRHRPNYLRRRFT